VVKIQVKDIWGKSSSKNPRSAKAIRSAVAEFVEDSANDGQLALADPGRKPKKNKVPEKS
jgi:hypothetical protein